MPDTVRAMPPLSGGPAPTSTVKFGDLIAGDRFLAFGKLYTKLSEHERSARDHSGSITAGLKGYGYRMDGIYTFESYDEVEYVPPTAQLAVLQVRGNSMKG